MTDETFCIAFARPGWREQLDLYLAERAHGMNAHLISLARLASVARMNLLSDEELAGMGLTAADIPAFIFEDLLPE